MDSIEILVILSRLNVWNISLKSFLGWRKNESFEVYLMYYLLPFLISISDAKYLLQFKNPSLMKFDFN